MITFLLLMMATPAAEQAQPPLGTVCVTASDHAKPGVCTQTSGDEVVLAKSSGPSTYVWRRASDAEIAVGNLRAGETHLHWPVRSVALRIRDNGAAAAEQVTIDAATQTAQWKIPLKARDTRALRRFAGPDEDLTVTASAAHRVAATVRVTRKRLSYELVLLPIPAWNGRVIDKKTRKGILGVAVSALPQEQVLTTTDYTGSYRFEVPTEWPAALRFTSGTYGAKVIPAPSAHADSALSWVELAAAGSIALEVEHTGDLDLELWQKPNDAPAVQIASQPLRSDEKSVRVPGLDEGDYEVRLRGAGPFERYCADVVVRSGEETSEKITLDPVPLDIVVMRDNETVPYAKLDLSHMKPRWDTAIATDAAGHAKGDLWQQGLFVARVAQPGAGGMLITRRSVTGTNRIDWRIDLKGGTVSGTVVDAVEHFPVVQAKVMLQTDTLDSAQQHLQAVTDDHGEFQFAFVPEGAQTINLTAVGYVSVEKSFQLTSAQPDQRFHFELAPAETVTILVVNSYGVPLVGAVITDATGSLAEEWVTNAEGRAAVTFRRGQSKTLFVLPREGSIAISSITAQAGPEGLQEQQIVVPKGEATVDIRTQDEAGHAVPNVELLVRYNGVVIPEAVAHLMLRLHGNLLRTSATGGAELRNLPIGYYEFWPFFSLNQFQQLQRGPLPAGTALGATAGHNAVILTFERTK